MANNFSTIKDRCLKLAEIKHISKESFCSKIEMTYGNFKGSAKKNPLNSTAIANILTLFPDVNSHWIITGEGEMLKPENSIPILIEKSTTSDQRDNEHIELLRNHIESLKDQITTLKDLSGSLKDQVMILKEQISELKREAKHFESAPTASTSEGVAIPAALLTGSTPRSGKSR